MRHLQNMAKVMLATGLIVAYGYMMETFMAWYSANPATSSYVDFKPMDRAVCAALLGVDPDERVIPQALWFARVRNSVIGLFIVAMSVNIGMWLERFIIVVTSLHRDFLPSSWGMYYPTVWDWATFVGTIGLFLCAAVSVHSLPADDFNFRDARL